MSFLGTLAKGALGFVTGGPVGAAVGLASGFAPKARAPGGGPFIQTPVQQPAYPFEWGGLKIGTPTFPNIAPYSGAGGGGGTAVMAAPAAGCPTGFRLNKSTYVTRGGGTSRWGKSLQVHEKGTTCVRRRKLNAGNGRAATHAVRRLVSFYRLSSRVAKQLRRAAVKAHVGGGRRGQRRLPAGSGVQVIDTG